MRVETENSGEVLSTSQVHMEKAEIGPWVPCLEVDDTAAKSLIPSARALLPSTFRPHPN